MELTVQAYAKLNLSLDVISREPDGYHKLKMVMASADLHDDIHIRLVKSGVTMRTNLSFLPKGGGNIAVRAAELFLKDAGIKDAGVQLSIIKRIPVCAGMGGGSSDAAAVLRGVNRLFGAGYSGDALERIGQKLGSDVPYCVAGGTALAEGRGEILTPLPPLPRCQVVICKPPISVSTAEVFAKIDCRAIRHRPRTDELVERIKTGDLQGASRRMYNVFEDVTSKRSPIHEIKGVLLNNGALGAVMSGTGSTVFGIFDRPGMARAAYSALRTTYKDCFICSLIDRLEV